MFSFRLELYPLDEVSPWGGARPTLHWFGLTEGWYWIDANPYELLRRSRAGHPRPYIDYYLARLWEDVIALTPHVLESVPDDLRNLVQVQREHDDRRTWLGRNLERRMTTNWDAVREGAHLLHGRGLSPQP